MLVEDLLQESAAPFDVQHVRTLAEALESADGHDCALLDLGLPLRDGYELAEQLTAASVGRRRPVLVAVTGYGQVSDQEKSMAAGFDSLNVATTSGIVLHHLTWRR